jgi:hypothetical protein
MTFEFQDLQLLLRRRVDDPKVVELIGSDPSIIKRDEYYGSVEFQNQGVELVLKEAPWVIPTTEITDPKDLFVAGFHFHREGHEGYHKYSGHFPGGVTLNDDEDQLRHKLGKPSTTGGGGFSSFLRTLLPRWSRYVIDESLLHFQFDVDDKVGMVTLFVEALEH